MAHQLASHTTVLYHHRASNQGEAHSSLEQYEAAREAFLEALSLDMADAGAAAGLRAATDALAADTTEAVNPDAAAQQSLTSPASPAAAPPKRWAPSISSAFLEVHVRSLCCSHPASAAVAGKLQQPVSSHPSSLQCRQRTAVQGDPDDWECPLCLKLLWEPIATPCAHMCAASSFQHFVSSTGSCFVSHECHHRGSSRAHTLHPPVPLILASHMGASAEVAGERQWWIAAGSVGPASSARATTHPSAPAAEQCAFLPSPPPVSTSSDALCSRFLLSS